MPWRDPSRLTDADKARLDKLTERQANRLDVTSDAYEYVWGFRGNTPEEEHREKAGWASGTAHCYAFDLDAAVAAVHASNMTMDMPLTPGGKAVKGPGYREADLSSVLARVERDLEAG